MAFSVTVVNATRGERIAGIAEALAREVFAVEVIEPPLPPAPPARLVLAFVDAGAGDASLAQLARARPAALPDLSLSV